MPSLKEIKNRIASVQSTRKITSAMKMVASSKLHHAQVMIENMLPYENMLETILKTYLAADMDAQGALTQKREVKKVAMLVFASNSSMSASPLYLKQSIVMSSNCSESATKSEIPASTASIIA